MEVQGSEALTRMKSGWIHEVVMPGVVCVLAATATATATAIAGETLPVSPAGILQELRSFGTVATILHVGAHPDDENTALITYFARGRGFRTAYLSLTRGDGGQNMLGSEFDEKLGVARTQELLAARQLDGGRQFFSRAIDFGYSKSPEETLRIWNHDEVLADVVRILRLYRPDVVVTRFPVPPGSGGHGHHTASAILALEAFKAAGDPGVHPEQIAQGLSPWQPRRIVWNGGGNRALEELGPAMRMDIGGDDPVTGESFAAIAGRSRAMHVTQGFGNFGGRGGGGPNLQSFTLLAGSPATNDLFDGIDTTWKRIPGGAEIGRLTDEVIAGFNSANPAASVPKLLGIRAKLAATGQYPVVADKRAQLDRILVACLGLSVETLVDRAEVVPGERVSLRSRVRLGADVPVRWVGTRAKSLEGGSSIARELHPGKPETVEFTLNVPAEIPVTQPYWLEQKGTGGLFRVEDPGLIGTPENPPAFPIEHLFQIGDQQLVIQDEPVQSDAGTERPQRLGVIPPVSLRVASAVSLFRPGTTRSLTVEVIASRPNQSGVLRLGLPDGWNATPVEQPFQLDRAGAKAMATFDVVAPPAASSDWLEGRATVNGRTYHTERQEIRYSHLPLLLLQPSARTHVVSADVVVRGKKVGYLPGAGDATDSALRELGYAVTQLTERDLAPETLRDLDAVVIGVRAFNVRKELRSGFTNLFPYVEKGGTVVVQYNRPDGLDGQVLGPYPLSIQGPAPRQRITDEQAPVRFLKPGHPVLNVPNAIGPADFDHWIQERGAYFPSQWDAGHYDAILTMNDPGEQPLDGGLMIARHGQGYFVYTSLAFFRQLPAGVPGAWRLFANLVSLGK